MSTVDLWIRDVVSYYGSVFLIFLAIAWFANLRWRRFVKKFYRSQLLGFESECSDLALAHKKELFRCLNSIESKDEILRSEKRIRVLEIGVKTGENIQFYPDGTHFIGVDWNTKLRDYLTNGDRSWQFSHICVERILTGDGSSLYVIPSECVDVVVTTRSLCSARSVPETLSEIRRILVPDGKYLFIEHTPHEEGTYARKLQDLLTTTKIWQSLFGNCRLDSDPIPHIKKANFKNLYWKSFNLDGYVSQPNLLHLTRNHVMGTAIN